MRDAIRKAAEDIADKMHTYFCVKECPYSERETITAIVESILEERLPKAAKEAS